MARLSLVAVGVFTARHGRSAVLANTSGVNAAAIDGAIEPVTGADHRLDWRSGWSADQRCAARR